jgi:hypothetical protein
MTSESGKLGSSSIKIDSDMLLTNMGGIIGVPKTLICFLVFIQVPFISPHIIMFNILPKRNRRRLGQVGGDFVLIHSHYVEHPEPARAPRTSFTTATSPNPHCHR